MKKQEVKKRMQKVVAVQKLLPPSSSRFSRATLSKPKKESLKKMKQRQQHSKRDHRPHSTSKKSSSKRCTILLSSQSSLVFNSKEKTRSQENTDIILKSRYSLITECPLLHGSFHFCSSTNLFSGFLHSANLKSEIHSSFTFLSCTQLPSLTHIEVYLRTSRDNFQSPVEEVSVTVNSIRQVSLTPAQLRQIYAFSAEFLEDFIFESQPISALSFHSFNDPSKNTPKLLFVLTSNSQIDYALIQAFSLQRKRSTSIKMRQLGLTRIISDKLPHHSSPLAEGCSSPQLEGCSEILNSASFCELIKSSTFRHCSTPHNWCQVLHVYDPCCTTLGQFIDDLSIIFEMSREETCKKIGLNEHSGGRLSHEGTSLFDFIYNQIDNKGSIGVFDILRKQFKSQHKTSSISSSFAAPPFHPKNPLAVCRYLPHLKNFDFLSSQHISLNKSCLQSIANNFQTASITFSPVEHLELSALSVNQTDQVLLSFAVFATIQSTMAAMALPRNLGLESFVHPGLIVESCSLVSFSNQRNLELLEVVGDVVIKYLSTLFLATHLPDASESALSFIRSRFINNKFLGVTAFKNHFHFFLKAKKTTSNEYKRYFFNAATTMITEQNHYNHSSLADMLEAVFAAFFVTNNFDVTVCLQLSKRLQLMFHQKLADKQVTGSFAMDNTIIKEYSLSITKDMSYKDLSKRQESRSRSHATADSSQGIRLAHHPQVSAFIVAPFDRKRDSQSTPSKLLLRRKIEERRSFEDSNEFAWDELLYPLLQIRNKMSADLEEQVQAVTLVLPSLSFSSKKRKSEIAIDLSAEPSKQISLHSLLRRARKFYDGVLSEMLSAFEDNCINYRFTNRELLVTALTANPFKKEKQISRDYQLMEFLGDAVIEILLVSSGYNFTRSEGAGTGGGKAQAKTPLYFAQMKLWLLSNDFLSRMALLNDFHYYLINASSLQKREILVFTRECGLDHPFAQSVTHLAASPKVLGDLVESLAAAVLIDSDVTTLVRVFTRLFGPFLAFFIKFHAFISFNEKGEVYSFALRTKQSIHSTVEPIIDTYTKRKTAYKSKLFLGNNCVGQGQHEDPIIAEKRAYHQARAYILQQPAATNQQTNSTHPNNIHI